MQNIDSGLIEEIGDLLRTRNKMLATAESCTGGWVAQTLTSVSGSSEWFERGFVTYSNDAKQEMLGVKKETLERYGAVSEQTAREMAEGVLKNSHAQVSLAITGIAGPTGGTEEKPVGTVWFAWAIEGTDTLVDCQHFTGERNAIRSQAVVYVLNRLLGFLKN